VEEVSEELKELKKMNSAGLFWGFFFEVGCVLMI
jgi:hypothetical protein